MKPNNSAIPAIANRFAPSMFLLTLLYLVIIGIVLHWWNLDPVLDEYDRQLTLELIEVIWLPFLIDAAAAMIFAPGYPGKIRRILLVLLVPPARLAVSPHTSGDWVWLPGKGWKRKTRTLYRFLERKLALPMLGVTLMILPLLAVEFLLSDLVLTHHWLDISLNAGIVFIWIAFAAELSIMLTLAPDKIHYLKAHWINVLIVLLPALAFLRGLRVLRLAQLAKSSKLLRVYRLRSVLLRGYESLLALSIIERMIHRDPEKHHAKLRKDIEKKTFELMKLKKKLREVEKHLEKLAREPKESESLWGKAWYKFRRDRTGMYALGVVIVFFIIALGVWLGLWGQNWSHVGGSWAPPSKEHWLGTNIIGQDIFSRGIYSTKTAFEVGMVVAILSTILGGILGALSGYFTNGWIDEIILWLMGVLDSIPFYLFVAAIAYALQGYPYAMHVAMIATFWTTTARLVRGEVIKLKNFEFVEAARAIGLPQRLIIFRHIMPNTFHILLVQATIVFVGAIKSEVILSFLSLGVVDGVSWGVMIAESTQEVQAGHYTNFITASVLLFTLVMAFNMFSDSLQDALDPKKVSA